MALPNVEEWKVWHSLTCPGCKEELNQATTREGVRSRLFICKSCRVVWLLFGVRLFPCADVSGLLVPGQM